jgi:outer membrane lipoprotein-sorting protein
VATSWKSGTPFVRKERARAFFFFPLLSLMRLRRRSLLTLALFFAALLGSVAPVHAQTPDAQALIDRLEAKYDGGQVLRAQFTQTTSQPGGQTRTLDGTLTLAGDRYRVETGRQTLVTNGETTWVYTPSRDQVLVNDYVKSETAFSPGQFFDGYQERYRATGVRTARRSGTAHRVLTLEPRQGGAFFQQVTLWVRASDAVVTRMVVEDAGGSQMTFSLRDVTFGAETTASTFRFEAPQGVEVVDLRS